MCWRLERLRTDGPKIRIPTCVDAEPQVSVARRGRLGSIEQTLGQPAESVVVSHFRQTQAIASSASRSAAAAGLTPRPAERAIDGLAADAALLSLVVEKRNVVRLTQILLALVST